MGLADQLTLLRVAAVPLVVAVYISDFRGHDWWATGLFIAAMTTDWFDGRVARSRGRSSPLGSLLDPVADKLLVLTVLVVLVGRDVFAGWMVAAKRGSANKIGYLAAHSAIVLVCLGGLLDGDMIVRAQMWFTGKTPYTGGGMIADVRPEHRLPPGNPTGACRVPRSHPTRRRPRGG